MSGLQPPTLAVNAIEEELEEAAAFCRDRGIGLEVTAFAYPANLDDGYSDRVARHVAATEGISPVLFHGPFLDLYPTSPDPRVVGVARERHEKALAAAASLGARMYVAHLNSIPLIRNRQYLDRFAETASEFWGRMADRATESETIIVLENMWEAGPELQKAVVERARHPNLKASFDNGHALVFSERPAAEWIRVLGEDLRHLHLHDNDGTYDEHRVVGTGAEDWSALIKAWQVQAPAATLVMENDRLEPNRTSLRAVRQLIVSVHGTPSPPVP